MIFPQAFLKNSKLINVIIETPKSSSNKYAFDPQTQLYKLSKILPNGIVFPHHFGFLPSTVGQDGDPLDVLVFMNEPSYPGCLIECRLLGVIEAEQSNNGKIIRNDRFVAVANESHHFRELKSVTQLDSDDQEELINFLYAYTKLSDKKLKVLGCKGPVSARQSIKKQLQPPLKKLK